MTKKELLKVISDEKIKDTTEVRVLCTRAYPIPVEIAYYDKKDNMLIIETN